MHLVCQAQPGVELNGRFVIMGTSEGNSCQVVHAILHAVLYSTVSIYHCPRGGEHEQASEVLPEFKAQVVLEVISGAKSAAEI